MLPPCRKTEKIGEKIFGFFLNPVQKNQVRSLQAFLFAHLVSCVPKFVEQNKIKMETVLYD